MPKERAQLKWFNRIAWNILPAILFWYWQRQHNFVCVYLLSLKACCVLTNMARFILQCAIFGNGNSSFFLPTFFYIFFFPFHSLLLIFIQLWNYFKRKGNHHSTESKSDKHTKQQVIWTCFQQLLLDKISIRLRIYITFLKFYFANLKLLR